MQAAAEETLLLKTRELCQTLVDQPEFQRIRQQMESFLSNDDAKAQYQLVVEKGDYLQHKQQMGVPLDGGEIAEFEKNREVLLSNPVAREFIDAQERMQQLQDSVVKYVTKTFELGRVPTSDDFSGGCGSGCGCH
ncbi:MAG TPA: YlbF family regulator [Verrucomicrobiae bacterium]|nr:YlbF family regulator [Verrucomicrobiae bacterium]